MKKQANYLFSIFLLSLLIITNIPFTQAVYARDWQIGETVNYGYRYFFDAKTRQTNDTMKYKHSSATSSSFRYEILEIDQENMFVSFKSDQAGGFQEYSLSYNTSEICEFLFIGNLFGFNYHWDYELNKTRLVDFRFNGVYKFIGINFPFIEPEWEYFNNPIAEQINPERVIDYVVYTDGSQQKTLNITFGDFLDSIKSYKIMGKNDIISAQNVISNNLSKWSFEFDLSGYIVSKRWDKYFDYEKYIIALEFEFTEGGTWKSYSHLIEYNLVEEHIINEYKFSIEYEKDLKTRAEFEFISVLGAVLILSITIAMLRKRMKNVIK